ncbi:hypothetical protein [Rhizobium giardinii]|uniref:hypothetical protein n=1 Tax=Rhizobium giardinii TaxID=56731 RepID=UPI003D70025B
MADDTGDAAKLTKILQRLPSDPSAGTVFLNALASSGRSITDVRVVLGDELDRLRSENTVLRASAPSSWEDFSQTAKAMGYERMPEMAEAVGVDVSYLKTCRQHNQVPDKIFAKLRSATDRRDPQTNAGRDWIELKKVKEKLRDVTQLTRCRRFLELKLLYFDVPQPAKSRLPVRSDMTVEEFREIAFALFPDEKNDGARCDRLSGLTGYSGIIHRAQAGLVKQRSGENLERPIAVDLADYLRTLHRREMQRGTPPRGQAPVENLIAGGPGLSGDNPAWGRTGHDNRDSAVCPHPA